MRRSRGRYLIRSEAPFFRIIMPLLWHFVGLIAALMALCTFPVDHWSLAP